MKMRTFPNPIKVIFEKITKEEIISSGHLGSISMPLMIVSNLKIRRKSEYTMPITMHSNAKLVDLSWTTKRKNRSTPKLVINGIMKTYKPNLEIQAGCKVEFKAKAGKPINIYLTWSLE
jgi:hypothetical protein